MSQTTELLLKIRQQGGEQLTKLQGSLKNLGQQSSATNVNFKQLAEELRKVQSTSVNSINNLKGYASAWREIANSVKIGSAEFRQASAEAAKLEKQLQRTQGRGGGLRSAAQIAGTVAGAGVFGGFEGAAGAGIGALFGGVPGAVVGGAIGAQVGGVRQALGGTATYAADISRQRQALQLVTKDAGEYQRALSFIDKTSRELAIPQDILTRQFTQLTASVKGAGGNVRDAEKAFIGIASGIRGTGGSLEQLDSALTATSQVFSKGKVSAEELRQQIGERLPGAFSLFAKSIGMTPQELDKALEKGQVSLQDFQKFAEQLFAEYGENAKIIADGPDAAGDRLRTSLSRLSESVGTLLKPIGAAFQRIFAGIVEVIDKAVRKFNQFTKLLGHQDLTRLRADLKTQDALITELEQMNAQKAQKGSALEEQYTRALEKRKRTQAEIARYELQAKPTATSKEPPSRLPGILPDEKDTKSEAEKLARIAQQAFNKTLQQLGIDLGITEKRFLIKELYEIESQIQEAIEKGNKDEEKRLELLKRRATLEVTETALLDEKERLEKLINEGRVKGVDVTNAANKLSIVSVALAQNQLDYKRQYNEELKLERALTEEYFKQFAYNGDTEKIPTVFSAFEEQIRSLREAIADTFPEMVELSNSLSSAFGNAFQNLVFSTQSARESLAQLFTDIAKSFQDMIIQMITDYLKLQIITFLKNIFAPSPVSLLGNFFGGGAPSQFTTPSFGIDATGLAGPVSPFAMGGIMTEVGPLKLKRYAVGGIANSPQLAMFGEGSRPEAYVPLPDGRTIPVTMKNGNNQATTVTVNVDASGTSAQGNAPNANALGNAIGAAVQAELIKQKRPGGLLA
jgi:tape measure domain-containing protein